MATRLYLRSTTDNTAGYVATEKSTVLPAGTGNLGGNPARDLSTTAGASPVTGTLVSLAQTAHQDGYFRKFISAPLTADITAQTWTLGVAVLEGNNAANAFIVCSVYVLTSGDTVRGYVYDSDTELGAEWALGSNAGRVVTFSGAAVSGVVSTDRLVLEFWYHGVQSMANAYTADFGYGGATDIVEGVANSDPASYVETPQNDLFGAPAQTITGTLFSRPPTFFTGVITSEITSSGVLLSSPPSFISGLVQPGNVTTSGSLFSSSPAFFSGVIAAAAGSPSVSLYATAGGTISNVVNEADAASPLWSSIDDDPAAPTDSDWVNNTGVAGNAFFGLTDIVPTDFASADSAEFTIRVRGVDYGGVPMQVVATIYAADETTPYSDSPVVATVSANTSFANEVPVTLTLNAAGLAANKTAWDAAKLQLVWSVV